MTTRDVHVEILRRARVDPKFRKELIENPRKALQDHFNLEIPDDIDISVVEKPSWKSVVLVLPPLDFVEVEDKQLHMEASLSIMCTTKVPGGTCWLPTVNSPTCRLCK